MELSAWILPRGFEADDVNDFEAFVYLITNTLTGRAYVGKKFTQAKIRGQMRQSDWPRYFGSSKYLKADIDVLGKGVFRREIISLHATRKEANFAEVEEQFGRKVLTATLSDGSPAFYNRNIMGKFFVTPEIVSDEARANLRKAMTPERRAEIGRLSAARTMSPENKRKLSERMRENTGWTHSDETKAKISKLRTGSKISERGSASLSLARRRDRIAKLTEEEKQTIRTIRDSNEPTRVLSERFGKPYYFIQRIRSRETFDLLD